MQRPVRLAFCSLLVVFAAPLRAQSASSESATVADTAQVVSAPTMAPASVATPAEAIAQPAASSVGGAPMTGLRAGVHAVESTRSTSAPAATAAAHANLGQSRALMVVGVAGLIVGAIIGGTPGTLIMVGGALVGLKGLYDYLQ
jgi:hypothetical protein